METYNCPPWNNKWEFNTSLRYLKEFFEGDRFVGYLVLQEGKLIAALFGHEKTWWTKDELFIDELYVSNKMQGKGFGGKLLEKAESYVKERKLAGITLLTNKYMPSASFYQGRGFIKGEHVLFMYKEL